jgi:hypothetical protein
MVKDRVIEFLAAEAVRDFGDRGDGLFNTAGFQQAVKRVTGTMPDPNSLAMSLESCARIVRLSGGCHWMFLPDGHRRFSGQPTPG